MPELFGIDIAALVAQEIGPGLKDVTLSVVTPGIRNPNEPTAGVNSTIVSHIGKGVVLDYEDSEVDGTIVQRGDRQVLLIADTFPNVVPSTTDRITAEGRTYNVINIERDPAAATYTCQVR